MRRHVSTRLAQSNFARQSTYRRYSKKPGDILDQNKGGPKVEFTNDASLDPRPPWFYSYSTLLRILVVPAGFIYAIFFHDFGKQEHVFMPPRRWLQRQKEAFFTLSPSERQLVKDEGTPVVRPDGKAV